MALFQNQTGEELPKAYSYPQFQEILIRNKEYLYMQTNRKELIIFF